MSWFRVCPWFSICKGSEYARVIQGSEYARICLINGSALIYLNMPEYAGICVNMPKSAKKAFALHFPAVIPCLLERAITYFNVNTKLEVVA